MVTSRGRTWTLLDKQKASQCLNLYLCQNFSVATTISQNRFRCSFTTQSFVSVVTLAGRVRLALNVRPGQAVLMAHVSLQVNVIATAAGVD